MDSSPYATPGEEDRTLTTARVTFSAALGLYSVTALLYLLIPPLEPATPIAASALLVAGAGALGLWLLPRLEGLVPLLQWGLTALAALQALCFVYFTGDPAQTVVLLLVLVAAGSVLASVPQVLALAVFAGATWAGLAIHWRLDEAVHWTINLGSSAALASAICYGRLRLFERLDAQRAASDAARDAAIEATRIKSRFLATASHELRTPLNAIVGSADLLRELELGDAASEHAETIGTAAQSLLELINDLLDLSRLESGRLEVAREEFAVHALLDGILTLFSARASAAGIVLEPEISEDVPRLLVADHARIRQVLVNLVDNAVKHTEAGSVRIGARAAGHGAVTFSVEDTGVGMSDSELQQVFDSFWQADMARSGIQRGAGLGLAISKRLVQAMGGEIKGRSRPGEGSSFSFTIPAPAATTPEVTPRRGDILGGRVLLVDDNPVNRRVAQLALQKLGMTVELAVDGVGALEALEQERFDLVLMDLQMPRMDGLEAARSHRRRGEPAGRRTPIIALTANALAADRQRAIDSGMDDFLAKPVALKDLERTLRRWLPAPG